ncbi:MAG: DUF6868 family protein [Luteolibacter sp.]
MNLETLREFLGWCSIINIGLLMFSTVAVIALRDTVTSIHSKLFCLDEATLHQAYFRYLANFKIAVIVFNIVPYLALRIMG